MGVRQRGAAAQWRHSKRKQEKREDGFARLSYLSDQVYFTLTNDAKYFLCFLGAAIIRLVMILYSAFLLLWLTSFVDSGYLANEQASKDLY